MMTERAQFDALQQSLYDYFGYSEFRAGQREVLEHLMSGKDALAVFPTGAGKSLTYQLAALLMPGTAIIVSPLIALMRDQVVDLQSRSYRGRVSHQLDADRARGQRSPDPDVQRRWEAALRNTRTLLGP